MALGRYTTEQLDYPGDGLYYLYTYPMMLCHLGDFLGRPLMRESTFDRTA
jgi:hypothetical protein